GLSKNKVGLSDAASQEGLPLINARNIRADGNLNINDAAKITITNSDDVSSIKALSDFQLRPNDILLTAISSELRLALWPAELSQPAVFSSSLIRVRVRASAPWKSEDVF